MKKPELRSKSEICLVFNKNNKLLFQGIILPQEVYQMLLHVHTRQQYVPSTNS